MGENKDFKPVVLRNVFLVGLLGVTLVLLGMVEWACRVLPHVERKGEGVGIDSILSRSALGADGVHNQYVSS